MKLDLETIAECIKDLNFSFNFIDSNRLEINIHTGIIFIFENMEKENDNIFGFQGTPWHSHNKLILMIGDNSYIELSDVEIILGIKNGDILICEQYIKGKLSDRWLSHKNEKNDNKYIQPEEEIRYRCYPFYNEIMDQ